MMLRNAVTWLRYLANVAFYFVKSIGFLVASWIGLTKCHSHYSVAVSGFGSAEILRGRPCFGHGNLMEMFSY